MVQTGCIAIGNERGGNGRWRMIGVVLIGLIGLALIIMDLWADSLPDWLVDDVSDDD